MGRIILAIVLAIGCTTLLDATGYTALSALPLIPLFVLFALLGRMNLGELGFRFSGGEYWGYAIAHPLFVLGSIAAAAQSFGALDLSRFNPGNSLVNIALLAGATFVMAVLTEEGFFRGWLWAALGRKAASPLVVLTVTTAAFASWHVPFVFLSGEFAFGTAQIPLFFANAALLGLIWGLLRLGSGSILVSSLGHGLWNGLVYVLFGVGSNIGALGIRDVAIYGPEVGILGVTLNAMSAAVLFWAFKPELGEAARRVTADAPGSVGESAPLRRITPEQAQR